MKKIEMIKTAAGLIVSVGVGAIVGNTLKCTTPATTGVLKRVCIGVGAFVLSNMVGDRAVKYTEEKIDDAVKTVKDMVEKGELETEG